MRTTAVTTTAAMVLVLALASTAAAQACPAGRACFYLPPALPQPPGPWTSDWDMVLASPRGTITGTWRAGTAPATPFTVTPGAPVVVPLSAMEGTLQAFGVAEHSGIFIDASSAELLVDHRLISGPWQSSTTVKSSAFSLGRRFRVSGYDLNTNAHSVDTGFDYVSVYAPFGGDVTFTAPSGAGLPLWEPAATASFTITLMPGETFVARTRPGMTCDREIDGALVTSTLPIVVDSGGRGWSDGCLATAGCGDDGADNVLPVTGLGTEFVLLDFPSGANDGERGLVVTDTDGAEVRVNGTLVATLAAGVPTEFPISGTTYVETSAPAYVFETTGLDLCETDIALIPAISFAPVGGWIVDIDVAAGFGAQIGVVIPTGRESSLTLDGGAIPAGNILSSGTVPGRPDLTALRVTVSDGRHTVRGASDFQLGLVTGGAGTGLFGYYTPFRIPGCGDGTRAGSEGCDDANLADGDGCSSSCKIEIGFGPCAASDDCVPAGFCDAGTCRARCRTASECDDSNACTVDVCSASGACGNAVVPAGMAGACTLGLVCTGAPADGCVQCVDDRNCSALTPHCSLATHTCVRCSSGTDCDDGNECTADLCTSGVCEATPIADGTPCTTGRCLGGTCRSSCGDGIVQLGVEACDDGNTTSMDGCTSTCMVEPGWACGCTSPTVSYSMEALAGRIGGDGGGVAMQLGCAGSDVLIGVAIDWSNGRGDGVRTTTICGAVTVDATGVVTTTATTRSTDGGSGCFGWDPSTRSPEVTCPSGFAVVGLGGLATGATLFDDLSIVCQQIGPSGAAFGPTTTLHVPGGAARGTAQSVSCPLGQIARFFQPRRGCGQDALDLFCGVASADCGGAPSICSTNCGDGVIGAPRESCDDGNVASGDGCSVSCALELDAGVDAGIGDGGVDAGVDAEVDAAPRDAGSDGGRAPDDGGTPMDATAPDAASGADAGTPFGLAGGACGCAAAGTGAHAAGPAFSLSGLLALLVISRRPRRVRSIGRAT